MIQDNSSASSVLRSPCRLLVHPAIMDAMKLVPPILLGLMIVLLTLGCSTHEWEPTQLMAESIEDSQCRGEIEEGIDQILRSDGLLDPRLPEEVVHTLITDGAAEQFINLYGGDEIRHWRFAHFDDRQCYLYNEAVTEIDTVTNARHRVGRPVRSWPKTGARLPLEICDCQQ